MSQISQDGYGAETKDLVKNYWTRRSEGFAELRKRELNSYMAPRWLAAIKRHIPEGMGKKVLDIGTGSGFFCFLLEQAGYETVGIDLTESMIEEANLAAKELGSKAEFLVMDAEHLHFQDEQFDLIVSRNLTWTLPHPEQAYSEWYRVLKKGGVMLNFDADYGTEDFAGETKDLPAEHAHNKMDISLLEECNRIRDRMEISRRERPAYDVTILEEAGFLEMSLDLGIGSRIYSQIDEFFNPAHNFLITAKK